MTNLSKAKMTLAVVCVLFFVLGGGAVFAVSPWLVEIGVWRPITRVETQPDFDAKLGLTRAQIDQRESLYREWDAELKSIDNEMKKGYYPRIQEVNKRYADRLYREILTPAQRATLDELSTGRQ